MCGLSPLSVSLYGVRDEEGRGGDGEGTRRGLLGFLAAFIKRRPGARIQTSESAAQRASQGRAAAPVGAPSAPS